MRRTVEERFWEKVAKADANECWLWKGSRVHGYGVLAVYRDDVGRFVNKPAHRISLELARGPIPKGMEACHHCDNPPCVNPAHLFVGDKSANMRDSVQKGRHHMAARTHCPHGHLLSGANVYVHGSRRQCRECRRARNRTQRRPRSAPKSRKV